jgi:hypothetical protein
MSVNLHLEIKSRPLSPSPPFRDPAFKSISNPYSYKRQYHAVMNALEFVFTPHNYLPTNILFPFTVPATSSSLIMNAADVVTITTPTAAVALPTETVLATDVQATYNTSTPLEFLFYVVAQSQRIFVSSSAGGIFFGGPARSYWMLTLFMVLTPTNFEI